MDSGPSAPTVDDSYDSVDDYVYINNNMVHIRPKYRLPPSHKMPIPSAPPIEGMEPKITNSMQDNKPDYINDKVLNIPPYVREKKIKKNCCIIC